MFGIPSSSSRILIGPVVFAVGASHVIWGFGELFLHYHVAGANKVLLLLMLSSIIGY